MAEDPKEQKSLYEATNSEIFWKNFLVGFGRGIGGLAVQIVLFGLFYLMFMALVMPKIQPLLNLIPSNQPKQESSSGILDRFMNGGSDSIDLDTPTKTN